MKKNFLLLNGLFLFSMMILMGCQKEIKESLLKEQSEDNKASANTASRNNLENACRIVTLDWSAGGAGIAQFHYNEKGLADHLITDFGGGYIIEETMYYDDNNRLIKADEIQFGFRYTYLFYYTGERLTRLTRTSVDFPANIEDFRYTYNEKGQITRQDDDNTDVHVLMYYDDMGNCTRTDVYHGSELGYSDNYTYEKPIRNPTLNVPGIEVAFFFYGGTTYLNKRHFTSNRTVIYDNGEPFVYNDYDPSKTIANTGNHNFPGSVNYYDRVSQASLDILFDYENCDGKSGQQARSLQANRSMQANGNISQIHPGLFLGSLKSIKDQIEQKKRQSLKKSKMGY